jgi:NitT/TauT family transport system substrate-binding protein
MIARRSWLGGAAALSVAALPYRGSAQSAPLVRIGISPAETYAQPLYGREAGIFTKDGLNVEVVVLSTGAAVSSALAGGSVDIGVSTVVNIANAITRGIPFVMIAPAGLTTPKVPSGLLVVPKNSPIRSAVDLEGKSVAIPALRQVVDLALRVWLTKGGADPAKVQIVEAPFPDMGPGVERGIYGAAIISEPSLSGALKNNNVRSLGDPYEAIAPEYPIGGWATTKGFIEKNPALGWPVGEYPSR